MAEMMSRTARKNMEKKELVNVRNVVKKIGAPFVKMAKNATDIFTSQNKVGKILFTTIIALSLIGITAPIIDYITTPETVLDKLGDVNGAREATLVDVNVFEETHGYIEVDGRFEKHYTEYTHSQYMVEFKDGDIVAVEVVKMDDSMYDAEDKTLYMIDGYEEEKVYDVAVELDIDIEIEDVEYNNGIYYVYQ